MTCPEWPAEQVTAFPIWSRLAGQWIAARFVGIIAGPAH